MKAVCPCCFSCLCVQCLDMRSGELWCLPSSLPPSGARRWALSGVQLTARISDSDLFQVSLGSSGFFLSKASHSNGHNLVWAFLLIQNASVFSILNVIMMNLKVTTEKGLSLTVVVLKTVLYTVFLWCLVSVCILDKIARPTFQYSKVKTQDSDYAHLTTCESCFSSWRSYKTQLNGKDYPKQGSHHTRSVSYASIIFFV